jgi:hypothetical protein
MEKIVEIADFSELSKDRIDEITNHLDQGGTIQIKQAMGPWQAENTSTPATISRRDMVPRAFSYVDATEVKQEDSYSRTKINSEAWKKYILDPYVSRSMNDLVGRVCGEDFGFWSKEYQIQTWLDEIIYDVRNELYGAWDGHVIRKLVENELFLTFTVDSTNGFVEIDVVEPGLIEGDDNINMEGGFIFHPRKRTLPVYYRVKNVVNSNVQNYLVIPSIYCAYLPGLEKDILKSKATGIEWDTLQVDPAVEAATGGKLKYKTYMVSWRTGVREIRRAVSNLRTVFEPLEDYKEAKKWRFEYMKALCTYFIFYSFEDVKSWLRWAALSDEQKRATGLAQRLNPADRLFLPPGVEAKIQNPQIPSLSGQDEDLLKMISSGIRQPYDMLSGDLKGPTYASIKGSRTPYMDYISDLREMVRRFYRYDFWKGIFFIKSKFDSKFEYFSYKEVVGFKEGKEDKKYVTYHPEDLVEMTFPQSSNEDIAANANALLGSKRGSVSYHLGIAKEDISRKLGFNNFHRSLLKSATERLQYPEEVLPDDADPNEIDSATTQVTDQEANSGSSKTNITTQTRRPKIRTKPKDKE